MNFVLLTEVNKQAHGEIQDLELQLLFVEAISKGNKSAFFDRHKTILTKSCGAVIRYYLKINLEKGLGEMTKL